MIFQEKSKHAIVCCDFQSNFQAIFFLKFQFKTGYIFQELVQNSAIFSKIFKQLSASFTPKLELDIVLNVHGVSRETENVGYKNRQKLPWMCRWSSSGGESCFGSKAVFLWPQNICNKNFYLHSHLTARLVHNSSMDRTFSLFFFFLIDK